MSIVSSVGDCATRTIFAQAVGRVPGVHADVLADHGGPAPTAALGAYSSNLAVNTGDPASAPVANQRGARSEARPQRLRTCQARTRFTGRAAAISFRVEDADGLVSIPAPVTATAPGLSLTGRTGRDVLIGWISGDTSSGGVDLVFAGGGTNGMFGSDGNDALVGRLGADTMTCALESDVFLHAFADGGADRLCGFNPAEDQIAVSASGFGGGPIASAALLAGASLLTTTTASVASGVSDGRFLLEIPTRRCPGMQIAMVLARRR